MPSAWKTRHEGMQLGLSLSSPVTGQAWQRSGITYGWSTQVVDSRLTFKVGELAAILAALAAKDAESKASSRCLDPSPVREGDDAAAVGAKAKDRGEWEGASFFERKMA